MDILTALLDLIQSLGQLLLALAQGVLPWTPLIAWIAWWMLAVDWVRLRSFLLQGGWVGVLLIALTAVLVWGVVAPPPGGTHSLLGLHVSNFVGKTMYVTALLVIMLLCGSVQLSGACARFLNLEQPSSGDESHDDHGHGDHGHGHDDHHDGHAHAAHHGSH
jgi:hypothetical protein